MQLPILQGFWEMVFMCSFIFLGNSLDSHARVTYGRWKLIGAAAQAPNSGWKAPLRILVSLAGRARASFVSVGSEMRPAFFARYYQEWGYGIGGNTFIKALYNAPLSPLWNWTVCFWRDFKWNCLLQEAFFLSYYEMKELFSFIFSLVSKEPKWCTESFHNHALSKLCLSGLFAAVGDLFIQN